MNSSASGAWDHSAELTVLDAIIEAMRIVNEYGMDGISIGVVVAFAMDLYEHGIITKEQTDGIDLKFGNAEALNRNNPQNRQT